MLGVGNRMLGELETLVDVEGLFRDGWIPSKRQSSVWKAGAVWRRRSRLGVLYDSQERRGGGNSTKGLGVEGLFKEPGESTLEW